MSQTAVYPMDYFVPHVSVWLVPVANHDLKLRSTLLRIDTIGIGLDAKLATGESC
jgi:hypothetical protein